ITLSRSTGSVPQSSPTRPPATRGCLSCCASPTGARFRRDGARRTARRMPHCSQDAFRWSVAPSGLMAYETSETSAATSVDAAGSSGRRSSRNKVPEVTVYFWIITMLCTTVGETAADLLGDKAGLGLTGLSVLMSALLAVVAVVQFRTSAYRAG